jgi:hypothetical protein
MAQTQSALQAQIRQRTIHIVVSAAPEAISLKPFCNSGSGVRFGNEVDVEVEVE